MNEKTDQNQEFVELPDERTESEREQDRQIERLDSFLSDIQPGAQILIERIQPSWCSGVLEQCEVPDPDHLLDYLIETWGGKILTIKIRGRGGKLGGKNKVPLNSYPPLFFGKPLKKPNPADILLKQDKQENTTVPNPVVVQQSNQLQGIVQMLPALVPAVFKYLQAQQNQRQQDLQMMLGIMGHQNNGLNDIAKIGATMTQLRDLFQQNNPEAATAGGDMDFMSSAMEVIKLALGEGNKTSTPKLVAPQFPQKPTGPPPQTAKTREPATVTPIRDLSSSLAELDPYSAVQTVMEGLGKMPEEKRALVVDKFIQDYYADMEEEDDPEDTGTDRNMQKK